LFVCLFVISDDHIVHIHTFDATNVAFVDVKASGKYSYHCGLSSSFQTSLSVGSQLTYYTLKNSSVPFTVKLFAHQCKTNSSVKCFNTCAMFTKCLINITMYISFHSMRKMATSPL
jgi:hypothetical protein